MGSTAILLVLQFTWISVEGGQTLMIAYNIFLELSEKLMESESKVSEGEHPGATHSMEFLLNP
jgi:hypothetical protein